MIQSYIRGQRSTMKVWDDMKTKAQKKPPDSRSEILHIETQLRRLAANLEDDFVRRAKLQKRKDYGPTPFDQRFHEYKIEAGRLLAKAYELGGLRNLSALERLVGGRGPSELNPESWYSSTFEVACLKWIPKQSDGFDFKWKRKQVGDVPAYAAGMRYLADCLVKSQAVGE